MWARSVTGELVTGKVFQFFGAEIPKARERIRKGCDLEVLIVKLAKRFDLTGSRNSLWLPTSYRPT